MTDRFGEMEVDAALMEGTGIYREAPFDAPADAGIKATLVHARQVKQINGRKGSFVKRGRNPTPDTEDQFSVLSQFTVRSDMSVQRHGFDTELPAKFRDRSVAV